MLNNSGVFCGSEKPAFAGYQGHSGFRPDTDRLLRCALEAGCAGIVYQPAALFQANLSGLVKTDQQHQIRTDRPLSSRSEAASNRWADGTNYFGRYRLREMGACYRKEMNMDCDDAAQAAHHQSELDQQEQIEHCWNEYQRALWAYLLNKDFASYEQWSNGVKHSPEASL